MNTKSLMMAMAVNLAFIGGVITLSRVLIENEN